MDAKAKKVKLTETFIEAFSGIFRTSQTSKMELFVKIFNSIKPLTIFAKGSILNVWLSSKYTSVFWKYLKTNKSGNFFEYSIVILSL